MKWYKNWDYKTHNYFWWTQRDQRGICFEIRKDNINFNLYVCEEFKSSYVSLQAAMNAAAII